MRYDHGFLADPQDVIDFAWSAPMRDLAAKLELSDVGLKKIFTSHGITVPPQGHWNRVHAGKAVGAPPKAAPRRPGGSGRLTLDSRFRGLIPEAGPISEHGPFASKAVPEDLDELRSVELRAIGKVTVPRELGQAHAALGQLFRREEQLKAKQGQRWLWDGPQWDGPLAQRQLRIINALFKTLSKRGAEPWSRYSQGSLELYCRIGTSQFQLGFGRNRNARDGERAPSRDLPASTKLVLVVDNAFRDKRVLRWEDGELRLEQQIAEIAADLMVAGEAAFRERLVEERERAEQSARWERERKAAELNRLREQRLTNLKESGERLRQAGELRALTDQVAGAVASGVLDVDPARLIKWREWVLREADLIDPVISGQVMTHIVVPELDDLGDE